MFRKKFFQIERTKFNGVQSVEKIGSRRPIFSAGFGPLPGRPEVMRLLKSCTAVFLAAIPQEVNRRTFLIRSKT